MMVYDYMIPYDSIMRFHEIPMFAEDSPNNRAMFNLPNETVLSTRGVVAIHRRDIVTIQRVR